MVHSPDETTIKTDYCREKAAPEGSGFYYAVLFEPYRNRGLLYALIALQYEILECLTDTTDPGITQMKLHWWREELQRLFQKQPRHPATRQLLPAVDSGVLEPSRLDLYLQTLDLVITGSEPESIEKWLNETVPGLGQIWGMAANLTGPAAGGQTGRLPVRNGGLITLLWLLQNVYILASKGYDFPPRTVSEGHTSHTVRDIDAGAIHGDCISRIANGLDECYRIAKKNCRNYPLFVLIMNRIARATCSEILKDGCRLQQHRISLTPLRKFWIALRIRMMVKIQSPFSKTAT